MLTCITTGSAFSIAGDLCFSIFPASHSVIKKAVIRMGRMGRWLSLRLKRHRQEFKSFLASYLLCDLRQVTYCSSLGFLICEMGAVTVPPT